MTYTRSKSKQAENAIVQLKSLQDKLVNALTLLNGKRNKFKAIDWLRDEGIHGGGTRYVPENESVFNRASVNFSHVQYDDIPKKKRLASATALSAIIHPENPYCPSIHMHFSWTEMRGGKGYWRMMADLNPSISNAENVIEFDKAVQDNTGDYYQTGKDQGDNYFFIPALNTYRGKYHFYLEDFNSGNFNEDQKMVDKLASQIIETYQSILNSTMIGHPSYSQEDKQIQIDYHTLYLYQVLTLDKGTVAGILVHNQNDLGILGSLPARINVILLRSWIDKTPAPFNELVEDIVNVLNVSDHAKIEDKEKTALAIVIRKFYSKHNETLKLKLAHK